MSDSIVQGYNYYSTRASARTEEEERYIALYLTKYHKAGTRFTPLLASVRTWADGGFVRCSGELDKPWADSRGPMIS